MVMEIFCGISFYLDTCSVYNLCVCVCVCVGEGNGTPLQYSCLENPMDGGAW